MTIKDTYKYTVDLTRLINERIDHKKDIVKLENDKFKIKLAIGKEQKHLAVIEKHIDNMVMEYNKK